jgi:hypothetical protein
LKKKKESNEIVKNALLKYNIKKEAVKSCVNDKKSVEKY